MIIGERPLLIPLDGIDGSLWDAARGVVRVSVGSEGAFATGWLITADLVVLPWYVRDAGSGPSAEPPSVRVETFAGNRVDWRSAATWVHVDREQLGVSLLRLERPADGRALRVGLDTPPVGQLIFVLQYAHEPALALSTGYTVEPTDAIEISYTADTVIGAGGAPVFDAGWRVVGIHCQSSSSRRFNQGIARAHVLERLRLSPVWQEICAFQQIADVHRVDRGFEALTDQAPAPILVRAAASASIDPATLTDAEAEALRPLVIDDAGARWLLRASDREDLVRRVGSRETLRAARGTGAPQGAVDRAIGRILDGPPYDLGAADDELLSGWMQAARWFIAVAPGLPSAAQANVVLERRRLRGRLEVVGGAQFRGRTVELDELQQWWSMLPPVPYSLTGIGGVGKSALVAHFALSLPADTVVMWLDFDRPDLAPDQAMSLLAALSEQAALQVEGLAPRASGSWQDVAAALGAKLAAALGDRRTLLVLDSFEVAQYADRYQQLWPVVEALMKALSGLAMIVTGRVPVANLTLLGQTARRRHLGGLEPEVARTILAEAGVGDPAVLDSVVELADGIPLILRLATQLVEAGGSVADLPARLPGTIVEGLLYERILDRMRDPALKPVARGVLVLRRISSEMIEPLLGGLIELPARPIASWFADLGKELAIVEGTDPLRVRAEVRAAALRLLERDDATLVRTIDERAAAWYASQPPSVETAAELVYHRLRTGDVAGAAAGWRDGVAPFLQYSIDELPEASQVWLRGRLGTATVAETPLDAWEADAAERIRAGTARGLVDHLAGILAERAARSPGSPLVFFDAYRAWRDGDDAAARKLLDDASPALGSVRRDRMILAALLRAVAGDRVGADAALAPHGRESGWTDHDQPRLLALAVRAARVVVATDLAGEAALARSPAEVERAGKRVLAPVDVLVPALKAQLGELRTEVQRNRQVESPRWSDELEAARVEALPDEPPELRGLRAAPFAAAMAVAGQADAATVLAVLGWQRWRIAIDDDFLRDAALFARNNPVVAPLEVAIAGALALVGHALYIGSRSVTQVLFNRLEAVRTLPVSRARMAAAFAIIPPILAWIEPVPDHGAEVPTRWIFGLGDQVGLALHLLGPDPLETLVHRIAGQVDWPPRKDRS